MTQKKARYFIFYYHINTEAAHGTGYQFIETDGFHPSFRSMIQMILNSPNRLNAPVVKHDVNITGFNEFGNEQDYLDAQGGAG